MFICVGQQRERVHMGMNSVYCADEMFDRISSHLKGRAVMYINWNGALTKVEKSKGLSIQFGPDLYEGISNEHELGLACRMVVKYHDSLRTQSEMYEIEDAERYRLDSELLEAATAAHLEEEFQNELDELSETPAHGH